MTIDEDLLARRDNPKNDRNHSAYDPDYAAATVAMYRARFGDTVPERPRPEPVARPSPDDVSLANLLGNPAFDRNSDQYDPDLARERISAYKRVFAQR